MWSAAAVTAAAAVAAASWAAVTAASAVEDLLVVRLGAASGVDPCLLGLIGAGRRGSGGRRCGCCGSHGRVGGGIGSCRQRGGNGQQCGGQCDDTGHPERPGPRWAAARRGTHRALGADPGARGQEVPTIVRRHGKCGPSSLPPTELADGFGPGSSPTPAARRRRAPLGQGIHPKVTGSPVQCVRIDRFMRVHRFGGDHGGARLAIRNPRSR